MCALCSNLFIGEAIIVLFEQKYLTSRVCSGSGLSSLLDSGGHCVDLPMWVCVRLSTSEQRRLAWWLMWSHCGGFKTASLCLSHPRPGASSSTPRQKSLLGTWVKAPA